MMTSPTQMRSRSRVRDAHGALIWAGLFFIVSVAVHNGDHLRRGLGSLDTDVFSLGTLGIPIEVGVGALILMRHRLAPIASVVAGLSLASGYVLVHFLPQHPWFSDSFPSNPTSWMSWTAASSEVIGALLIAAFGYAVLRSPQPTPSQDAIAVPGNDVLRLVVIAFALSQVLALAISLAQKF